MRLGTGITALRDRKDDRGEDNKRKRMPDAKDIPIPKGATAEDVDPEVDDAKQSPPLSPPEESVVCNAIRSKYERCQDAQWIKQIEGIANENYYYGNQWLMTTESGSKMGLRSMKNKGVADYNYSKTNYVGWCMDQNTARIVAADPDVGSTGLTTRQNDKDASDEANNVIAHVRDLNDLGALQADASRKMQCYGAAVLEADWDSTAWDDVVTKLAPDGSVLDTDRDQVGVPIIEVHDICNIFADPKAVKPKRCEYVIKASLASVNDNFQRYGVRCEGGPDGLTFISFEQFRMLASGDFGWERFWSKDQCLNLTYWEKPTKQFKNGRLIVICKNRVLRYTELPTALRKADQWHPYRWCYWRETPSSLWGWSLGNDLRDPQDKINMVQSNVDNRAATEKPVTVVPRLAGMTPGKMKGKELYETVDIDESLIQMRPEWQVPPPVSDATLAIIETHKKDMMAIAGVSDILSALTPQAVSQMSGAAIEVALDATQVRLIMPIKSFQRAFADTIRTAVQYWEDLATSLPRYLAIDQDANPGQAGRIFNMNAMKGGNYRVKYTEASGLSMTPGEQLLQTQDDYDKQRLGPIGTPAAIANYYEDCLSIRRTANMERKLNRLVAQQAATPPPPNAAEVKMQAQQQQAQLDQQQAQMEAQLDIQKAQQEAAIDAQAKQAETQMQLWLETQKLQAQGQQEQQTSVVQHSLQVAALQQQFAIERFKAAQAMQAASQPKISLGLTATPGPQGIEGIEQMAGLPETDDASDLAAQQKAELAAKPMAKAV